MFVPTNSHMTVCVSLLAGLVITTPQGTLVPTASTQSFVAGHPTATTMIVSAVRPSNTGNPGQRVRSHRNKGLSIVKVYARNLFNNAFV